MSACHAHDSNGLMQSSYLRQFCRVVAVSPGPRGAAAARPRLQPRADVLDQRRQRVVRQAQARGPPHERHARNTHPRQLQDTGQHHLFTINYHYSMLSLKETTSF